MADIEPPSFSLGLDLDADELNPPIPALNPDPPPIWSSFKLLDEDDDDDDGGREAEDFDGVVMDSDVEQGPNQPRILKRLRRGPGSGQSRVETREPAKGYCDNEDDEIENFSSQEDFVRDVHPPTPYNSVCSSSKVPLRGCRVLTRESTSQWKGKKKEQASVTPASLNLETGSNGLVFPKLIASPLRRFQLIDSDSDEPSISERKSVKTQNGPSSKEQQSNANGQKRKVSFEKHQNDDLWKDFCPIKSSSIPTPTLDEVCAEYFQSLQDKNAPPKPGIDLHTTNSLGCHQEGNSILQYEQSWNSANPLPPSHHYFFHDDPRIQKLVRSRLPNFSPLGSAINRGNQQPNEPAINYMSQFDRETSKQKRAKSNSNQKGVTRGRNKSKESKTEASHASQGWVDPKSSAAVPKDAGKRRVQASGQAAGHWYTSPEGRKVYVSRSGQELAGQFAYKQYKRDSGGFRKSKKKTNPRKKKG